MLDALSVLPLLPSDEERGLCTTVAAMSRKWGPGYFQRVSAAGGPATEQFRELARPASAGATARSVWVCIEPPSAPLS